MRFLNRRTISLVVFFLIIITVVFTVVIAQRQQTIRQRAAGNEELYSVCAETCYNNDQSNCESYCRGIYPISTVEVKSNPVSVTESHPANTPVPTQPPVANIPVPISIPKTTSNPSNASSTYSCTKTYYRDPQACANGDDSISNYSYQSSSDETKPCDSGNAVNTSCSINIVSAPTPARQIPTATPTPVPATSGCVQRYGDECGPNLEGSIDCSGRCIMPTPVFQPTVAPTTAKTSNNSSACSVQTIAGTITGTCYTGQSCGEYVSVAKSMCATEVCCLPVPTSTQKPTSASTPTLAPTVKPTNPPTAVPAQGVAVVACLLRNRGDANCNGKIDIETIHPDRDIWWEEFIQESQHIVTERKSDFNNDGSITIADFNIWRNGYLDQSLPHELVL